ncbi:ABC transporter permease [Lactococcus hodotermopsidis]|uniref:ABC transporter permease n=1 Tax=Pseudolactococcus hodotermopsidis TaxID=2709157 RepID=A0A6A0BD08_9LACT|nr:ABC transporter permease [Lactococcus hodotermopsidis]GFH43310.1 ABC transporter permease [Lactococcus hodotermopsidis]
MIELFNKRRAKWHTQNIKYMRYVFNDHFVLVLLFLIAFLAVQYAQFLKSLPKHWLPSYLIALVISVMVLFVGRLATFVEEPDQQFLLAKEMAVQSHLKRAAKFSLILPAAVIALAIFILSPLVTLGLPLTIAWACGLIVIKYFLLVRKSQTFIQNNLIQWRELVAYEESRKNAILKVFSQFTDVKGLRQTAKRRKVLDRFLPKSKTAYDYLFVRTYLRSGDYLMLTLRLSTLAILALIFIDNDVFALLLAVLFDYLLVFQLLPILQSQDYQILTKLYPITEQDKKRAARDLIRHLLIIMSVKDCLASLIFFENKVLAGIFVLTGVFLGVVYPRVKLK